MSKWKVYISSTFIDLKDFRAELINLFQKQLKNNFELCEIMEHMFDDGTFTPHKDDCVKAVIESDIYIIILGNRTGSFPPDEDRTYTEIELDTALANDKRIFCLRLENFDEKEIDNKVKHDELLNKFKGRPIHTFNEALDLKNALYEFLFPFSSQTPVNQKNPYKGLASFDVDDGEYFFGRNAELESCLKKIVTTNGNCFVSVIGNSGTGKSSFVKAGLLFRFKNRKELGFTDRPQIIISPGREPFTNLKYQLQLQGFTIEDLISRSDINRDFVLYFDQFEEVITLCQSPEEQDERKQLIDFLNTLVSNENQHSKVLVITSFRSDFLSQLANFDYIKSHQYLFPISSLDYKLHTESWDQSITEIITRPALENGVIIEKELVNQLLNELKKVDGALPILQFTLKQIWNKENIKDRQITSTEYNKLSKGEGMSGLIESHAEKVVISLTNNGNDKEREAILKTIFVNLVEVNENLNDVKRTVPKDELFSILKQHPDQMVNDVFETLVSEKSRLLNISQDKDEAINVGIIHEELIRKWDRLKGWINERREALETKKRITLDIAAFNKGEESLYGRKQVKRANQWQVNNPDLANEEINSFLLNARRSNSSTLYKASGIVILTATLMATVILVWVQPFIQKRDFENTLLNSFPKLYNRSHAAGGYEYLQTLTVNEANSSFMIENIRFFNNLIRLNIDKSTYDNLLFLNNKSSNAIQSLIITNNKNLKSLEGIQALPSLTSLNIINNDSLESIEGIQALQSLTSLKILDNGYIENLEDIQALQSLSSLTISNKGAFEGIQAPQFLTHLKTTGEFNFKNIEGTKALQSLTSLEIHGFMTRNGALSEDDLLKNLEGIPTLQSLTSFSIGGLGIKSLEGIQALKGLTSLSIDGNFRLENIEGIQALQSLTTLTFRSNQKLKIIEGIQALKSLTCLTIKGPYKFENLEGIQALQSLTSLTIDNNNLKSLEGIENLSTLTSLTIRDNNALTSLKGIDNLSALNSLTIEGNNALTSLEGLENLTSLDTLRTSLKDISTTNAVFKNNPDLITIN